MAVERLAVERRVLVLAPTPRDGELTAEVLHRAGVACVVCESLEELWVQALAGAAALVLPEEVVREDAFPRLSQMFQTQAVWSDLPTIVLSQPGSEGVALERLGALLGNVTVVECPMRVATFTSAVHVALRARERQYQVRDYLEEQNRVEATLARDAALLTNVRDSVVVTDLSGVITYWNDGATRLFGWSAEEMIGRPLTFRVPEPSRRAMEEWIKRIAAGRDEFNGEWLDVRKDGSPVWIEATTRLAWDAGGKPIGIIGVSRDITQRKEAEAELKAAKEAAEEANLAKDDFLAVLSHELRTPLTSVLLTAAMLEGDPALPNEVRGDIAMIRENIELESRLIGDLLDVTRIAKGKLKLDFQNVDAHRLVRAAIAICQREVSATLLVELHATRTTVHGDGTRLQQIFWNLINNAAKFTPVEGQIIVRSFDGEDGKLCIEVCDTGEGIDPHILPRLFTAFEQGNVRPGRSQAGLGLGLSISRKLAELHGGTVIAQSAGRGKGSTFRVELPARAELIAAPPTAPANGVLPPAFILLIEDHEATVTVMAKMLRLKGHRVAVAGSIAGALAEVNLHDFDLIISDLGLPDGSGLNFMRGVKDRYAGRAIALTGFGMDADIEACRRAGFTIHLTKPVNLVALEEAIYSVLGQSKGHEESAVAQSSGRA